MNESDGCRCSRCHDDIDQLNTEKLDFCRNQAASLIQRNIKIRHRKKNFAAKYIQKYVRGMQLRTKYGVHNPYCSIGKKFINKMFSITI